MKLADSIANGRTLLQAARDWLPTLMPKQTLSLSNELHLIIDAVRGVHRLTRH